MECPKCDNEMEQVRYGAGDRVVHRCSGCAGLFFKPIDLQRLKNTYKAEIIDAGSSRVGREYNKVENINCPVCDTEMEKVADDDQSHIWYESCPNGHGVYFDAGELKDLSQDTFMDVIKGWITRSRT